MAVFVTLAKLLLVGPVFPLAFPTTLVHDAFSFCASIWRVLQHSRLIMWENWRSLRLDRLTKKKKSATLSMIGIYIVYNLKKKLNN